MKRQIKLYEEIRPVQKKKCLQCGYRMEPGMLQGWWNCARCKLWIDFQFTQNDSFVQYRQRNTFKAEQTFVVPKGTLLILYENPVLEGYNKKTGKKEKR